MASRAYRRKRLSWAIKVIDKESDTWIGNVRDITIAGMGIIIRHPLKIDSKHTFIIDLSDEPIAIDTIALKSKVIWCQKREPAMYMAGIQFYDISKENEDKITKVIDHFGFST